MPSFYLSVNYFSDGFESIDGRLIVGFYLFYGSKEYKNADVAGCLKSKWKLIKQQPTHKKY